MGPSVPQELQQLVCVCANEFASDFFLGLNFNRLLRPARPPGPKSPEEKAELQKRVNSLVDKWAVQHAERLKAAKRRRTQSK
jgi:hypothetical protein